MVGILSKINFTFKNLILHAFLLSADFLFRKILSGIPLECETVRSQIWPDLLSDLI